MTIAFFFTVTPKSGQASLINDSTFSVVKFTGYEAISTLYRFDISLVSENTGIDISQIIGRPACLSIQRVTGDKVYFQGILSECEELESYAPANSNPYISYKAGLVPAAWKYKFVQDSRVFFGNSIKTILDDVLNDETIGMTSDYFSTEALSSDSVLDQNNQGYRKREYICKYEESTWDFISRWCEKDGISYFFKQERDKDGNGNETGTGSEKLIFSEHSYTREGLEPLVDSAPGIQKETYGPILFCSHQDYQREEINLITCRHKILPKTIQLTNSHSNLGTVIHSDPVTVDSEGIGQKTICGEQFDLREEGTFLATIMAQELSCNKKLYHGESTVPFLTPGYTFTLSGHDSSRFNKEFLIKEVRHEGYQPGYVISGLSAEEEAASQADMPIYKNTFVVLPAVTEGADPVNIEFRPERVTPAPKISGTIQARIVADDIDPLLDEFGRYKVLLPFGTGKISTRIRMMQPYASHPAVPEDTSVYPHGFHFPLHNGAEILISFIDGNPDRPVITGALANSRTKSPVVDTNQTQSVVRDHFGNELSFESKPGEEEIKLSTPKENSYLTLGKNGVKLHTDSDQVEIVDGNNVEAIFGTKSEFQIGSRFEAKLGSAYSLLAGMSLDAFLGSKTEVALGVEFEAKLMKEIKYVLSDVWSHARKDHILSAGDGICIAGGMNPDDEQERNAPGNKFVRLLSKLGRKNNQPPRDDEEKKNNAIINACGKGILMSYGPQVDNKDDDKWDEWAKIVFPVFAALSLAAGTTAMIGDLSGSDATSDWATGFNTAFLAAQSVAAAVFGFKSMDTLEPEFHKFNQMNSVVGLNSRGVLIGTNAEKAAQGIQVEEGGDDAWKKNLNAALDRTKTRYKGKIEIQNDGTVNLNSAEKEISFFVGKDGEQAMIALGIPTSGAANTGVIIKSGQSEITMKKDGAMTIKSNDRIEFDAKTDFVIKRGAATGFSYKSDGEIDIGNHSKLNIKGDALTFKGSKVLLG